MFGRAASRVARWAGHPFAFLGAALIIVVWGCSGPYFRYSDTWQLVINTGTTIVTFLMVFLLQNSQNRDGAAIQAKLDVLIKADELAPNEFIKIDELTQEEIAERREGV
jgi:low affinity Fe/Cu permease